MIENLAAIVWDFDGVINRNIVDGRFIWHVNMREDVGVDPEDLRRSLFVPHWQDIILGKRDLKETLRSVLPDIGFAGDVDAFVDYWFENDFVFDDAVLGVLAGLRRAGVPLYLGTNQEPNRAALLADRPELRPHFEGMFVSAHLGVAKPDAAFFGHVQDAIGAPVEQLMLIDDTPTNVEAAKALGWQTIHYRSFADLPDAFVSATR